MGNKSNEDRLNSVRDAIRANAEMCIRDRLLTSLESELAELEKARLLKE